MRFYRVAHVAGEWETSTPDPSHNGHPLYVHGPKQGLGRFDLPEHYLALYMARQPQAAVGELFQSFTIWHNDEITRPRTVDGQDLSRCLISIDTNVQFIDLDDAGLLDEMGWRPSDVVNKDRQRTQELALMQWQRRHEHGKGGFTWWSYCQPAWTVAMAWADTLTPTYDNFEVVDVEPLHIDHPAVVTAANSLKRTLHRRAPPPALRQVRRRSPPSRSTRSSTRTR